MAIVDKFRRAFRSTSGSNNSSRSSAGTIQPTQPTTTNDSSSTAASSSRLSKTISWRPKSKKKSEKPHPAERPLSESNLSHQELLGSFSMTFGRRRSGRQSFGGVSPCTSRHASVDAAVPGMGLGLPRRRDGSVAVVDEDVVMD